MRLKYSAIFLVLANLYPIYGAAFLDWNGIFIFKTYWCENLIIGLFTVLKMLKTKIYLDDIQSINPSLNSNDISSSNSSKIISFVWNYCWASFLYYFFVAFLTTKMGDRVVFGLPYQIIVPVCFIFLSHAFSYVVNFIIGAEYKKLSLDEETNMPFRRLITVHMIVIILGLMGSAAAGNISMTIAIVMAKIFLDIIAHLQEHNGIKKVGKEIKFSQ